MGEWETTGSNGTAMAIVEHLEVPYDWAVDTPRTKTACLSPSRFAPRFHVDEQTGALPGGLPPGGIYLYVFEW